MADKTIGRVFHTNLVHSTNLEDSGFQIIKNAIIGINSQGKIAFIDQYANLDKLQQDFSFDKSQIIDANEKFIIPGFVDTHIHAPQYPNAGTGTDLQLLDWLNKYTFPLETKYQDEGFARSIYTKVVNRTLRYGTTTACYFASIHLEATKVLAEVVDKAGQRALVGKVCMDQNSPSFYIEKTTDSIEDTQKFIEAITKSGSKLVTPVITPRFAPTCSSELLKGLGDLAEKHRVPIQTHISENQGEIAWVKELFPDQKSYTDVYDKHNLLNEKSIMAHAIYLSDEELRIFKERNSGICHCPISNFLIRSGVLDVRRVLKSGVKVGLGTDVSGGCSASVLDVLRSSITASTTLHFENREYPPLSYKEAFALATLGGAQVLGLEDQIGNFKVGKAFDALLIDPNALNSPMEVFEQNTFEDVVQKFMFLGDDRNIVQVFVNGVSVKN